MGAEIHFLAEVGIDEFRGYAMKAEALDALRFCDGFILLKIAVRPVAHDWNIALCRLDTQLMRSSRQRHQG